MISQQRWAWQRNFPFVWSRAAEARASGSNIIVGSDIEPQYPVFGNPLTATVRDNFQHAKDEIEELQQRIYDLEQLAWEGLTIIDGGTW